MQSAEIYKITLATGNFKMINAIIKIIINITDNEK